MKNIKLTIEYDGTNYHGWQVQPNATTVQGRIVEAIETLTGEHVKLIGASRTDEGVHALGQVANFFTNAKIASDKFCLALNAHLPDDIVVIRSEEVPDEFNARYDSRGKKYRYIIHNRYTRSALWDKRAYHVKHRLNVDLMNNAAKFLVGTHDFSSFRASGGGAKTSIRTIHDVCVTKQQDDLVVIEIRGDGFLYNMVRIVAGTLVDIGVKDVDPTRMRRILDAMDRKVAGHTAPPQGLYLVDVYY